MEMLKAEGKYIIEIPDHLDAMTSPCLKMPIQEAVSAADEIELDFLKTGLVTSAGLRILIQAQKGVQALGKSMTLKNVSPDVMEVFEITGLSKVFTFE